MICSDLISSLALILKYLHQCKSVSIVFFSVQVFLSGKGSYKFEVSNLKF